MFITEILETQDNVLTKYSYRALYLCTQTLVLNRNGENAAFERIPTLYRTREVPTYILGSEVGYADKDVSWLPSVSLGK